MAWHNPMIFLFCDLESFEQCDFRMDAVVYCQITEEIALCATKIALLIKNETYFSGLNSHSIASCRKTSRRKVHH